ncbi:unnamed protein product [Paramecium octaurelia]|uniref:Uncharacterized protein n=1 Tax=Paramecium octaurelia TaxID=43137 RepID=A0A8S1T5T8_PAROT|nr:unnamed protein product [Paramecium octaurelia]
MIEIHINIQQRALRNSIVNKIYQKYNRNAGFRFIEFKNYTDGVVAVHFGCKL